MNSLHPNAAALLLRIAREQVAGGRFDLTPDDVIKYVLAARGYA